MVRLALLMLLLATILGLLAALQNAPIFSMTMLAAVGTMACALQPSPNPHLHNRRVGKKRRL